MAFHRQLWNAFALLLLTGITSYYIHNGVRMTGSKVVEIAEEKVPELSKHDYDPWNTESKWTGFDLPPNLPNNYTYPYPMDSKDIRDATTQSIDELLFNNLKSRFRLIGDVARMTKMVCAIFIDSYQGKHIPEACDCTYTANRTRENSSSTFCVPNRNVFPTGVRPNGTPDCSVTLGYNSSTHGHGVKHHGSSYLKTLGRETLELLHRVRYRDRILFNVTRAVFEKQIDEMETQYKIRICDKFREPTVALTVAPTVAPTAAPNGGGDGA